MQMTSIILNAINESVVCNFRNLNSRRFAPDWNHATRLSTTLDLALTLQPRPAPPHSDTCSQLALHLHGCRYVITRRRNDVTSWKYRSGFIGTLQHWECGVYDERQRRSCACDCRRNKGGLHAILGSWRHRLHALLCDSAGKRRQTKAVTRRHLPTSVHSLRSRVRARVHVHFSVCQLRRFVHQILCHVLARLPQTPQPQHPVRIHVTSREPVRVLRVATRHIINPRRGIIPPCIDREIKAFKPRCGFNDLSPLTHSLYSRSVQADRPRLFSLPIIVCA